MYSTSNRVQRGKHALTDYFDIQRTDYSSFPIADFGKNQQSVVNIIGRINCKIKMPKSKNTIKKQ